MSSIVLILILFFSSSASLFFLETDELIQWALYPQTRFIQHMGINHGRAHVFMSKEFLPRKSFGKLRSSRGSLGSTLLRVPRSSPSNGGAASGERSVRLRSLDIFRDSAHRPVPHMLHNRSGSMGRGETLLAQRPVYEPPTAAVNQKNNQYIDRYRTRISPHKHRTHSVPRTPRHVSEAFTCHQAQSAPIKQPGQ